MTLPNYEIFALRYATMPKRTRRENFITHDPHDEPMPMDYFVWLIRGEGRTIMVDTGFNADQAKQRGRALTRCPVGSLAVIRCCPRRCPRRCHYPFALRPCGQYQLVT